MKQSANFISLSEGQFSPKHPTTTQIEITRILQSGMDLKIEFKNKNIVYIQDLNAAAKQHMGNSLES